MDDKLAVNPTESAPVEETQVEAVVESTPTEETEVQETEETQPVTKEPKHIRELKTTRKRAQDAERERDFYKEMAMKSQSQPVQQEQPTRPQVPTSEPKLEQFQDFDSYQTAIRAYDRETAKQEALREFETKQRLQNWTRTIEEVKEDLPDIDEAIASLRIMPATVSSKVLAESIMEDGKDGALVVHHLANNPQLAMKLAYMTPTAALKEYVKIQNQLKSTAAPVARKVSKAPEPIATVNTRGITNTDPEKESDAEYAARRRKEKYGY
jgi:hypothetical protein